MNNQIKEFGCIGSDILIIWIKEEVDKGNGKTLINQGLGKGLMIGAIAGDGVVQLIKTDQCGFDNG